MNKNRKPDAIRHSWLRRVFKYKREIHISVMPAELFVSGEYSICYHGPCYTIRRVRDVHILPIIKLPIRHAYKSGLSFWLDNRNIMDRKLSIQCY